MNRWYVNFCVGIVTGAWLLGVAIGIPVFLVQVVGVPFEFEDGSGVNPLVIMSGMFTLVVIVIAIMLGRFVREEVMGDSK